MKQNQSKEGRKFAKCGCKKKIQLGLNKQKSLRIESSARIYRIISNFCYMHTVLFCYTKLLLAFLLPLIKHYFLTFLDI